MNGTTKLALAVGVAAAGLGLAAAAHGWLGYADSAAGAELFDGRRPLAARVAGHDEVLPQLASRCSNCHAGADAVGGELNGASLAQPRARRGGPPSRYDAARLCRLLREGIDPAYVMVPREMPRYTIDDEACEALWSHLSRT